MKALSIKQPWAHLIAQGIKDIENRTWKTHFRGRIYIHASAKIADVDFTTEQTAALFSNDIWHSGAGFPSEMRVVSAIIGEVDIIDCVQNHPSIWAEKTCLDCIGHNGTCPKDEFPCNDIMQKPIYNWVLANPVLYDKPILNVKGKLSFWEPDICLQTCESCQEPSNIETMSSDDDSNWFCPECWEVLLPAILQEAKECK